MYRTFWCVAYSDGFFKQPHQVSLDHLLQCRLDAVVISFDEEVWWWRESLSEPNTSAVMKIQMKIWTFLSNEDDSNGEDALKIEALYRWDASESWMKKQWRKPLNQRVMLLWFSWSSWNPWTDVSRLIDDLLIFSKMTHCWRILWQNGSMLVKPVSYSNAECGNQMPI